MKLKHSDLRPKPSFAVCLCLALLCTSFPAAATSAALIRTAVLANDAKSVRIGLVSGHAKSFGVKDAGTTFGTPRLSADHRAASWQELRRDGGSYDSAVGIAIYVRGHLRYVGCTDGMPWAWRLIDDTRVVLNCAFPHGPSSRSVLLVDIESGKSIAKVELGNDADTASSTAPAWAQGKFPN